MSLKRKSKKKASPVIPPVIHPVIPDDENSSGYDTDPLNDSEPEKENNNTEETFGCPWNECFWTKTKSYHVKHKHFKTHEGWHEGKRSDPPKGWTRRTDPNQLQIIPAQQVINTMSDTPQTVQQQERREDSREYVSSQISIKSIFNGILSQISLKSIFWGIVLFVFIIGAIYYYYDYTSEKSFLIDEGVHNETEWCAKSDKKNCEEKLLYNVTLEKWQKDAKYYYITTVGRSVALFALLLLISEKNVGCGSAIALFLIIIGIACYNVISQWAVPWQRIIDSLRKF